MSNKTDNIEIAKAKPAIKTAFATVSDLFFRGHKLSWKRGRVMTDSSLDGLDDTALAFVEDIAQGRARKGVDDIVEAVISFDESGRKIAAVVIEARRHVIEGALDWRGDAKDRARVIALARRCDGLVLDQPSADDRERLERLIAEHDLRPKRIVEIPKPAHNDLRDYLAGSWWVHIPYSQVRGRILDKALRGALKLRSIRSASLRVTPYSVPHADKRTSAKDKPPTQRQLAFARAIAARLDITLDKEILVSAKVCSDFIARNKDAPEPRQPSSENETCGGSPPEQTTNTTSLGLSPFPPEKPSHSPPERTDEQPAALPRESSVPLREREKEDPRKTIDAFFKAHPFARRLVGPAWRRDLRAAEHLAERLSSLCDEIEIMSPSIVSLRTMIESHIGIGRVSDEELSRLLEAIGK